MTETAISPGDDEYQRFWQLGELDRDEYLDEDFLRSWLLTEDLTNRPRVKRMGFDHYLGAAHLPKFFEWIHDFSFPDWFPELGADLVELSVRRDRDVLHGLGFAAAAQQLDLANVGRYNAQDYLLQRFYPVPDRQRPRTILDFGAGHGRMANLAFSAPGNVTDTMISVDGIPVPYLTQRLYYRALGLRLADYLDYRLADEAYDVPALAAEHDVLHLPTWRLDLIPDESVDLICAVQVLRELPRQLVLHLMPHFARVLKPGGALYIRDHTNHHNPNLMPIDTLLGAHGFLPEFMPVVQDTVDLHGVPRIWRRLDTSVYG